MQDSTLPAIISIRSLVAVKSFFKGIFKFFYPRRVTGLYNVQWPVHSTENYENLGKIGGKLETNGKNL